MKTLKIKDCWPPQVVRIEWDDAHMSHDDAEADTVDTTCVRTNAGFLVAIKDGHAVLAMDISTEEVGSFRHYMSIPLGMIKSCKVLR